MSTRLCCEKAEELDSEMLAKVGDARGLLILEQGERGFGFTEPGVGECLDAKIEGVNTGIGVG